MTVSSTSNRVVINGTGATYQFSFAFYVGAASDLVVTYTDATGVSTVLSPGAYTVATVATPSPSWPTTGGTVTYSQGSPIPVGSTLTLQRIVPATQPTSISNQGAMWPAVIEAALDRAITIVQGFIDGMNRCLAITPTDGTTLNPLPSATARANSVLGFDGSGQPYAATLASGVIAWATWLVQNFAGQATSAANAQTALGLGVGSTIAAAGSYTLPGGLIVKWGSSGSIGNGASAVQTFPAAFPISFFGALAMRSNASGTSQAADYTDTGGVTAFTIHNQGSNAGTFFWVALGK
jgi:hypothetical protein